MVPAVDEVHWDDRPVDTVRENARRKAAWCRARVSGAAVIAADTVVVFEGRAIGKPRDPAEARGLLRSFSGCRQTVHSGVAMLFPGVADDLCVATSEVLFRDLDAATIDRYVALVDPLDKAGGYDIDQQGELIIMDHTGSLSNIMGLPMEVVGPWLVRHGLTEARPARPDATAGVREGGI